MRRLPPERLAALTESELCSLRDVVLDEAEKASTELTVEQLKRDAPRMIDDRRRFETDVQARLFEYWGDAFDLYEMTVKVAGELSEFFYRKHVPPDGVHNFVFEALGRLIARACRVAEEVLVLLKAGYGQAALARWRALHEIDVTALFLAEHDADCAERYFNHEAVETWNGVDEYQKHAGTLGQPPYSESEVATARARYDELLDQYGKTFRWPYGWAQRAMAASNPRFATGRVSFQDIEAAVGIAHMRRYYRMASHPVHANPKSVTWTPDLLSVERGLVLLTGPSPAGLADPGHASLIALSRIVTTALNSQPGEATAFLTAVLWKLTDEAGDAFLRSHQQVEAITPANAPGDERAV